MCCSCLVFIFITVVLINLSRRLPLYVAMNTNMCYTLYFVCHHMFFHYCSSVVVSGRMWAID